MFVESHSHIIKTTTQEWDSATNHLLPELPSLTLNKTFFCCKIDFVISLWRTNFMMPALFSRLPLLASLCYRFLLFIDPHIHSYRVLSNNSDILVRFHCNSKWYRKEIALFFLLTICSIHLIVLSILVPVALNVIFQSFIFCSQVSAMCWLSRLINLNWRFPQAAFPSSNERQVPVKVGAILLSNIKIEAFSSLSGAWRGLEGVIAPTGSHHLLWCSRCHWCPFLERAESLRV